MKLHSLLSSLAVTAVLVLHAHAQSNTATTPETNTQQSLTTMTPAQLTAMAWNFTGQPTLPSIGFIQITLTLQDGNSAPGDFDFNHLFLALDGVNTGLALNGFRGGGLQDTLTISGNISAAVSTQLLAQFADKMFVGTIVTDNASDTALAPNDMFVGNDTSNATTTLTLAVVPEPGTFALVGLGLVCAFAFRRRS